MRRLVDNLRVLLAIMLIGQFTGVSHALAEVWSGDDGARPCGSDCQDEDGPCLPFCATCTCAHAGRQFVPAVVVLSALFMFPASAVPSSGPLAAPLAIEPSKIFHPPKV